MLNRRQRNDKQVLNQNQLMEEFESLLQANLRYTEAILLASTSLTSEIEQQCQRLKDLKDQQPELIDA